MTGLLEKRGFNGKITHLRSFQVKGRVYGQRRYSTIDDQGRRYEKVKPFILKRDKE